jgi:hypothetical protein
MLDRSKIRFIRLGDAKKLTHGGDGPGTEMLTFHYDPG